ncbi:Eukaryotic translation initiation factor 3 subunit B [Hondaea fermentalgiana]|uniref:Eukaryotic translation initiation factor 2A n=1 Tax=Hondaea fermentalgiana TaxID=2315210 RepID=A0A2R5GMX1_9STRA|nr:Eukaryotic translation initiation factor 3 subunit B [Hondaea fermentalgiana]|eukprot:GBG32240.1 Eukaryotic translation initiation factor 3 subunit B [Hondaea fermentalgiana]
MSAEKSEAAAPEAPAAKPYKRIQYAVLGREGLQFKLGPNKKRGELVQKDDPDSLFSKLEPPVKDFVYSATDGSRVAVLRGTVVSVFDCDTGKLINSIERPNIMKMALSPLGTFLLTWEKYSAEVAQAGGNLTVWRVEDGNVMMRVIEKNLLDTTWPLVKWTDDENVAAYMVKNTVHMYDGTKLDRFTKVKIEGVSQFSIKKKDGPLSEDNPCRIAAFKPESNSGPAKLSVLSYIGEPLDQPTLTKSTFKATECKFAWAANGDAVLVKTETDVDTTGQSYYGESALYLLHADGQYDAKIMPHKDDGPFHDFAWSPQGRVFVAISGRSPASSVLYNMKGDAIFDFGQAHRNTIRFSPHGRFLCLGGFGNLSGDMDFWDMNKKSRMGSVRANCAVSQEWSPCGRFFMTGTLFPRMRVDNGLSFYTYRGQHLFDVSVREATKALFRPAAPGVYADRPQTPLKKGEKAPSIEAGAGAKSGANGAPKKPAGVYRPPGASGSLAAQMRAEREGSTGPRKLTGLAALAAGGGSSMSNNTIPGMTPILDKKQSANPSGKSKAALRRERKKKAEAARKAAEEDA